MIVIPSTIYHSAPVSAASTLDCEQWFKDCAQSLMWRSKPFQSRTWLRRWKRDAWIRLLCSRTCTIFHGGSLLDWWTSCLAASRANHSATPGSVKGWKIHATFGRPLLEVSGLFNQPASSLKTSMESPVLSRPDTTAFCTMSSATWKKWVTEQRQDALQQRKLAHHICGSDGSSLVWPTPRTITGGAESAERKQELGRTASGGGDLQAAVKNWPTPKSCEPGMSAKTTGRAVSKSTHLTTQVAIAEGMIDKNTHNLNNWPTPTGQDASNNGGPSQRVRNTPPLNVVAGQHDPDNLNTNGNRRGLLNPAWVETLMGFPTGWTDCVRLATQLFQQSQQEHLPNYGGD